MRPEEAYSPCEGPPDLQSRDSFVALDGSEVEIKKVEIKKSEAGNYSMGCRPLNRPHNLNMAEERMESTRGVRNDRIGRHPG